jgi:hypothetical protein
MAPILRFAPAQRRSDGGNRPVADLPGRLGTDGELPKPPVRPNATVAPRPTSWSVTMVGRLACAKRSSRKPATLNIRHDSKKCEGMTLPLVSPWLNGLFNVARAKYRAEYEAWVELSGRLSGRFNLVTAAPSIQREGDLDLLLRRLEDEFNRNNDTSGVDFSSHYQMMFSEAWIVGCYEILRAFQQRDDEATKARKATSGVSELGEFKSIFTDFELLRMPIAKFEIAKDCKLKQPLPMRRVGDDEAKPIEFYDPKDPSRFHIMPNGVSRRGSAVWLALDGRNSRPHWVERRDLADRLLSLLRLVKGAGELEAEKNAAAQVGR